MTFRGTVSTSTAAVELADYLVASADPQITGGIVELRLSQRQIASDRGVSVGTIHHHLTALSDLGVRVSSRPLRLDIERLAEVKRRGHLHVVTDQNDTALSPTTEVHKDNLTEHSLAGGSDPWENPAVAALFELASIAMAELGPEAAPVIERIAIQIVNASGPTPTMISDVPRDCSRDAESVQSREKPRDQSRGFGSLVSELVENPPNSLRSRDQSREGQSRDLSREHMFRQTSQPKRSVACLRELLRPLIEVCRTQKLPGLDNPEQALELLEHLTNPQLAFGVRRMVDRLNQSHTISVPIGWFIKRATAKELDPDWFPTTAPNPDEWALISETCRIDLDVPVDQWPRRQRSIAESLTDDQVIDFDIDEAADHLGIPNDHPLLATDLAPRTRRALIATALVDDIDTLPISEADDEPKLTQAQRRQVINNGLGHARNTLKATAEPACSPDPAP